MEKYGDDVAIVFKHQPLSFHQYALGAALAMQAANKQGKAWEMHDKMFEGEANRKQERVQETSLTRENFKQYAQQIGLDVDRFLKDLDDPALQQQITDDQKVATEVGARGTPAFYINGVALAGAQPLGAFTDIIDKELSAANELIKGGTPVDQIYEKRAGQYK